MNLDDLLSEMIGAIANVAVTNNSGTITMSVLAAILNLTKLETPKGEYYHNPHALVRKAHQYFTNAFQTAQNIQAVFVLNNNTPVIK